jgi:hypothetical protein
MRLVWGIMVVAACGGSPVERFCERRAACLDDTGIDFIDATRDVDWCVPRLERSIPDGAMADLEACASCLEDAECEQIELHHCTNACAAARSAIRVPGTLAGEGALAASCTSELLENAASDQSLASFGELTIELNCGHARSVPGPYEMVIVPDQAPVVGADVPCGEMVVRDERGYDCQYCGGATGTITAVTIDGRDRFAGLCTCGDVTVSFDVPYRFGGWVITTRY